jgi:hypothetical protein
MQPVLRFKKTKGKKIIMLRAFCRRRVVRGLGLITGDLWLQAGGLETHRIESQLNQNVH